MRGTAAQVLTWGGALLFLVGGLVAYPYLSSRLVTIPPTPTPTPTPTSPPPSPTAAAISATSPPAYTAVLTPTAPPTPTTTPTPTSTPIPAIPIRIVIPTIDLDAPVVPVSWETVEVDGRTQAVWEIPDVRAAGWHETSMPLGVVGNTVLNGHNTTCGEVFRDLYTLEEGDEIVVYSEDAPYTYVITEMLILPEAGQPLEVRIENAQYIQPTEDERLTLVTCHPYGSMRNRLIVVAHRLAK